MILNRYQKSFLIAAFSIICAVISIGVLTFNAVSNTDDNTAANNTIKFFQYSSGFGANGYDTVAYFNDSQAVEGKDAYQTEWGGVKWRFASADHLDQFLKKPERYIPQYGGHCAYGVSQSYLVRGDPQAWSVHNNKLYLNYSQNIRTAWLASADSFITNAANNWTALNR